MKNKTKNKKPSRKVFDHLINKACFIDTARFNINGVVRKPFLPDIQIIKQLGIHNGVNNYGLLTEAIFKPTGNPIQVLSHPMKQFVGIPPSTLVIRSEARPMTKAEVEKVAAAIYIPGFQISPSYIELTADIDGFDIDDVDTHAFSRARDRRHLEDELGNQTYYIGSSKAATQVCIYQKTWCVVRNEFRFHRRFFKENQMLTLSAIGRLQKFDLTDMMWLGEFQREGLKQAIVHRKFPEVWHRKMFLTWRLALQDLERCLQTHGIDTKSLLRLHPLQYLLNAMQKQLVW
jgi:hypothetical protein